MVVGSEAEVVLVVDPRDGVGDGDGLVDVEARLLLADAGELVEGDAGQAVELGICGQAVQADFACRIANVGEVVRDL